VKFSLVELSAYILAWNAINEGVGLEREGEGSRARHDLSRGEGRERGGWKVERRKRSREGKKSNYAEK
jgi:hypothetical protein